MTVYSKVSREPEEDQGGVLLRTGPILTPTVIGKRRCFPPEQKLRLMRWLDSLSEKQRNSVFRLKKNQWEVHPDLLRRWFREFTRGKHFRPIGRPVCVDPPDFRGVLDQVVEGEEVGDSVSLPKMKGLLREARLKTEKRRDDVLHREMSDSTMWRLTKGVQSHFSLTKRPNKTTAARYRAMASARRALDFYCCATALHARVKYLDLLLNVDSTNLRYIQGSSSDEAYFHSPSIKPNVKGTEKTLVHSEFLTMWIVESAVGVLGSLLFIVKCAAGELPDNKIRVGCLPSLSPQLSHFAQPAYVVFVNKKPTPEDNWVINGIKLELILDHIERFRLFKERKPGSSNLPKLFDLINGRASGIPGWSFDDFVPVEEKKTDEKKDSKKKKRVRQRFPILPSPPPVPPALKYRAVVWVDSEGSFLDYLLVKKQQERCSALVVDLVKNNPGATAVEQPADQEGFRDVKQLLKSSLSSATPDAELREDVANMFANLEFSISPSRANHLCLFFTAMRKILPIVYHPSRIQKQFTDVFGPNPLEPSRDDIVGKALGWNRLSRELQAAYVKKTSSIIAKFTTHGFVTDEDWEGCPWDPKFDEHRDKLTLSKRTCLHLNHEESKKKREAEEKLQEEKDKAAEEKRAERATKKVGTSKKKEATQKTPEKRAQKKEEAKTRKEEDLAIKILKKPPAAKRAKR